MHTVRLPPLGLRAKIALALAIAAVLPLLVGLIALETFGFGHLLDTKGRLYESEARILARSLENAVESQLYEPDLSHFHDVDGIWKKFMTVPPPRSSMAIKGLIHPGAIFVANFVVMIPDE